MKVAITGPDGFIAWHTRAALHANPEVETLGLGRGEFNDPDLMDKVLSQADAVIHLAGVNRTGDESDITQVNLALAAQLVDGLRRTGRAIPMVYGNSIHSDGDSAFGAAKRKSAELLAAWSDHAPVVDVVLPNIFGEHGVPFYNSVVATFCYQLANDIEPVVQVDRDLPLLHVQRAADILITAVASESSTQVRPVGRQTSVSDLLQNLSSICTGYRTADLPDLSDPFTRDLFNTYRSYTFPQSWPKYPLAREDQRGSLYETVRAFGGEAQVFFSTTRPGHTRGQHFHLRKVERFLVVRGTGVIRFRKLFSRDIIEIPVSGNRPAIVDMPTMWVHSIVNTGPEDLDRKSVV